MATNDHEKLLAEGLIQLCCLTDEEAAAASVTLTAFMEEVLERNKSMNLTAITDSEDFVIKHFLDSFSICGSSPFKDAERIIDVGTGAGFPGFPLAVVFPEKEFVLMDSLQKRTRFLEETAAKLGVKNVSCIHGRAEDLGRSTEHRERYDLCVSRAVAKLPVLCEYCLPLVKKGGYFAAYKTGSEDVQPGKNAIKILGGAEGSIESFPKLSGILESIDLDHKLIFIKKIRPTPGQYPRKAGTPAKNPL